MKRILQAVLAGLILMTSHTFADIGIRGGVNLGGDDGYSIMLSGDLAVVNQSLGWYGMRTYKGSDPGNILLGVDYGVKPYNGPFKLSIGPAYAQDPLRATGQNLNFHLAVGVDFPNHLVVSLDHWSNCRTICNHNADTTSNPPRNMLMLGVRF